MSLPADLTVDFTPGCKLYRRHKCFAQHRSPRTMAKCIWRRAHWITGDGLYASVSHCPSGPYRVATTVMLFPTLEDARGAKAAIDNAGCGGRCIKRHDVVKLILPTR